MTAVLHRFVLPIKTEADLRDFLFYAHGVKLPDVQVCANHTTPFRAFADAYFARTPVAVWKASRGFGGKTYTLGLLSLVEAETLKANVSLLGGSFEQSARVLDHLETFESFERAPRHLLTTDVAREMIFAAGNQVEALTASQKSVRGPHPERLRCDEIDEMELAILTSALGQPMSRDGILSQSVLSSTHQNSDGTMTWAMKQASERAGWAFYEWCIEETRAPHGWVSAEMEERRKATMPKIQWDTEVLGQEPNPESRAIDPGAVKRMFDHALGEFAGGMREYVEIEEPEEGAEYATGADWARKQDWTIIVTLRTDVKPYRLVAFERLGRESWDAMLARFEERVRRFMGPAIHDATGLGDVIDERIQDIAEGFVMTGRERASILNEYCVACERHEIVAPFIKYMEAEHRLASVDDVYGAGHLPDSISAGAFAYRAAKFGGTQIFL